MDEQLSFDGYVTKNFDFDIVVRETFRKNMNDIYGETTDKPASVPEHGTMHILKKMELKRKIIDV